jgi:YggT family protein
MDPKGAFLFLLFYAFDVYIFLVLTRFLLQLVRADFYNPISQFVVKATNPPLKPLRKLIPGYGGVDVAALVLVVALVIAKIFTMQLVGSGSMALDPLILMTAALHEIARLMLNYLFWSIVLRIVLSWIAPDPYNPMVRLVTQITEPVMAPARRLLPPMGGFDLSPILVIIAIQAVQALFRL